MSSMFNRFWGSQEQQSQPLVEDGSSPAQSRYPPSELSSPSSSSRPEEMLQNSNSKVPPTEAAGIVTALKDRSADELRKFFSDKEVYQKFLHSLDQVKIQNNLKDELCKESMKLVDENLQKEPRIAELRNQCRIIRTTQLASAQEKLNELEKQKEEMLNLNAPGPLLQRIQEAMNEIDDESENLHQQFLDREIDLGAFLIKYKKLRVDYNRKTLIHLAARTSNI